MNTCACNCQYFQRKLFELSVESPSVTVRYPWVVQFQLPRLWWSKSFHDYVIGLAQCVKVKQSNLQSVLPQARGCHLLCARIHNRIHPWDSNRLLSKAYPKTDLILNAKEFDIVLAAIKLEPMQNKSMVCPNDP
jgi:hypothetical protein